MPSSLSLIIAWCRPAKQGLQTDTSILLQVRFGVRVAGQQVV